MSKSTENPFAAFDLNKIFSGLRTPGFDPAALVAAQQKNFDAIATANRRALEGYQSLMKRQTEIFQETLQEIAEMMKRSVAPGNADGNATRQAELARQAVEKAVAHMRELAEMASKTNAETFDALNKRMTENLEDIRASFTTTPKK